MAKNYTANYKEKTGSTSGEEPVYLLEITHPQLAVPIRVVNDTKNLRRKQSASNFLNLEGSVDDSTEVGYDVNFLQGTITPDKGPALTFTRSGNTATRVNSQGLIETVAANTPRFDYDPVTLALKGLLIEEPRTNLLLRSEELDNASWTKHRATVIANAAVSPTGALTADKLVEDTTASATHRAYQSVTKAASPLTYTMTVYAKAAERTQVGLRFGENGETDHATIVADLVTGGITVTTSGAYAGATGTATALANGWWRITLTCTSVSATSITTYLMPATGGVVSYTGDGVSGVYLFGAQFEQATFSSSYIPTTTAAVTRNAEAVTVPAGTWVSEDAFTVVYGFQKSSLPVSGGATAMVVARSNNARSGYIVSGDAVLRSFDGTNIATTSGSITANAVARGAFALDGSGQALCRDGGTVATAAYDSTFDNSQAFGIGCNNTGGNQLNGHFRRFTLLRKRLANATLQSLSAGEFATYDQEYIACAFRIQFPEDIAKSMPRVPIAIDNVGRELVQWLEASNGGKGAEIRIMQVMRNTPNIVEQEFTMTLLSVKQNMMEVTGQLGYENVLDIPMLAAVYTPESAPGMF